MFYSYLAPPVAKTVGATKLRAAPLFPIPSADLALRPEIAHLLRLNKIPTSHVTFLDDLPKTNSDIGWVLVDHNAETPATASISPNRSIIAIIDHHEDSKKHLDAKPRLIAPTGSCTSLLTDWFSKEFKKDGNEAEIQLARLGLGAIAIDTTGMRKRTTEYDERAVEVLTEVLDAAGEKINLGEYADMLQQKKSDVGDMSLRDLLRKDYKEWTVAGPSGSVKVGISSLPVKLSSILTRFSDSDLDNAVSSWASERSIDLAIIMTSFVEDSKFQRELVIWAPEDAPSPAKAFLKSLDEMEEAKHLQLEEGVDELESTDGRRAFVQRNVDASRKQVAPTVVAGLKGLLDGE